MTPHKYTSEYTANVGLGGILSIPETLERLHGLENVMVPW